LIPKNKNAIIKNIITLFNLSVHCISINIIIIKDRIQTDALASFLFRHSHSSLWCRCV